MKKKGAQNASHEVGTKKLKDYRYLDEINSLDLDEVVKIDDLMTPEEKLFVDIYIRMLKTKDEDIAKGEALKRAGYEFHFPQTYQLVADRILYKFELKCKDHRDIFRRMGAGEVELALEVAKAVRQTFDEKARINLLNVWSRILGTQTGAADLSSFTEIIIRRTKGEGLEAIEPTLDIESKKRAAKESKADARRGRLVSITGQKQE